MHEHRDFVELWIIHYTCENFFVDRLPFRCTPIFETVDIQMVDEEVDGKLEQGQDIEYWNVMGRTKIMRIKTS